MDLGSVFRFGLVRLVLIYISRLLLVQSFDFGYITRYNKIEKINN